jgi:hypothetical protein
VLATVTAEPDFRLVEMAASGAALRPFFKKSKQHWPRSIECQTLTMSGMDLPLDSWPEILED